MNSKPDGLVAVFTGISALLLFVLVMSLFHVIIQSQGVEGERKNKTSP